MGQGVHTVAAQVAIEELGVDPERVRVVVDTTRELGAGQTTGIRGTLMGAGAVADACRGRARRRLPARASTTQGEYRVDWTSSIEIGRRAARHPLRVRLRGAARGHRPRDGRDRAGRRRARRRPGGEPAAVRRPDRGRGAHGPRLRAHRGLPVRRRRPPDRHDAARPRHHPRQGRAADRGDPGRGAAAPRALRHQGRRRDRAGADRRRGRRRAARPRRRRGAPQLPMRRGAIEPDDRRRERPPTPGLVCAHHHLYSALARGMPAPPRRRATSRDPRARLVAARPRPRPRDDPVVGDARRAGGARGGHDRDHRPPLEPERDRGQPRRDRRGLRRGRRPGACAATRSPTATAPTAPRPGWPRTSASCAPAAAGSSARTPCFTLSDETLDAVCGLAADLGVGVHVHVAEDAVDVRAGARLGGRADDDWLLAHGVHLDRDACRAPSCTTRGRT